MAVRIVLDNLAPYREKIDAALEQFFDEVPELLGVDLSEHSAQAIEYLRQYSVRSGKRMRGSLAAAAYDTAAGTRFDPVGAQLGATLELMQNYLLIIDDVMDRSALRRGKPTLHVLYQPEAKGYGGDHEANMLAVNVGEVAQHFANLLLARLNVPARTLKQAFLTMHSNIVVTGFGQLDDLYQQPGRTVSETDVLRKYYSKSSYYTFVNPLQLAFILAGKGTPEVLAACMAYGQPAGVAFQLQDDYLGIFGDAGRIGKPNLDDIREGKFTLMIQYALAHAGTEEKQRLLSILGNPKAGASELRAVQHILEVSGALGHNRRQAKQFAAQAKASLASKPIGDSAFQALLTALVEYSIERER